jgi:hypothetical protein
MITNALARGERSSSAVESVADASAARNNVVIFDITQLVINHETLYEILSHRQSILLGLYRAFQGHFTKLVLFG